MKLISRILAILVLLGLAFTLAMLRMGFRSSDKATQRYFDKRSIEARIHRIPFEGDSLRWVETGDTAAPLLVFVHGAPGSLNNFFTYLADSMLRSRVRMLSMDRPGYGYSSYGQAENSIARQATAIKAVLDHYGPNKKAILVGHSFGGPIIAKAAMDYPGQVAAILMVAPVIDPANERIFWFSHFARWKLFRWVLSPAWKVAGEEKFSHASALRAIASGWSALKVPVVHLHGEKDQLAPPVNADFSNARIPREQLRLVRMPEAGHMIPFLQHEIVREEILRLLANQP